jgi:hypothetical protein
MLKTALFESESAVRKVLNGLVQEERIRYNRDVLGEGGRLEKEDE